MEKDNNTYIPTTIKLRFSELWSLRGNGRFTQMVHACKTHHKTQQHPHNTASLHLILFLSCIDVTNCSIFCGCCIQHHPLGGYCSDLPECPCTPLFYPMVESVLPPTTRWLSASPEIQPYAQASLLTTSMAKPSKVSISLQF